MVIYNTKRLVSLIMLLAAVVCFDMSVSTRALWAAQAKKQHQQKKQCTCVACKNFNPFLQDIIQCMPKPSKDSVGGCLKGGIYLFNSLLVQLFQCVQDSLDHSDSVDEKDTIKCCQDTYLDDDECIEADDEDNPIIVDENNVEQIVQTYNLVTFNLLVGQYVYAKDVKYKKEVKGRIIEALSGMLLCPQAAARLFGYLEGTFKFFEPLKESIKTNF